MNLGPHASFIIAAYAVTGLVLAAVIAWIVADYRIQRRTLREFEALGLVRRSSRGTEIS